MAVYTYCNSISESLCLSVATPRCHSSTSYFSVINFYHCVHICTKNGGKGFRKFVTENNLEKKTFIGKLKTSINKHMYSGSMYIINTLISRI
jgi:hypothetical protein